MENIHGHEVIKLLQNPEKDYTKSSLMLEMSEKFGENAIYYTCSSENLNAEELIQFLKDKGKFIDTENEILEFDESTACKG